MTKDRVADLTAWSLVLLAVACVGGSTSSDAGSQPAGGGSRVTLTNVTSPPAPNLAWVAFQDGDGAWQTVDGKAGEYVFTVFGPRYGLAFVCLLGQHISGYVLHATPGELPSWTTHCDADRARREHRVGGVIKGVSERAVVRVFAGGVTGLLPGQALPDRYHVDLTAGTYDITAVAVESGKPESVLVRRKVVVSKDVTLDLDFVAGGRFTMQQPLVVSGATSGETLQSSVSLLLAGGGFAFWELASGGQPVDGYRALAARDVGPAGGQELTVLAASGTAPTRLLRGVSRGFHSLGPLDLTLPPAFASVKVEVAAATPTLRPRVTFEPYSGARFYQVEIDSGPPSAQRSWRARFTAGWLATATSYDLPDFSVAPGFDSTWAFQSTETLLVRTDAIRSSRGFLPTISGEVETLAGSQVEFASSVSTLRAP